MLRCCEERSVCSTSVSKFSPKKSTSIFFFQGIEKFDWWFWIRAKQAEWTLRAHNSQQNRYFSRHFFFFLQTVVQLPTNQIVRSSTSRKNLFSDDWRLKKKKCDSIFAKVQTCGLISPGQIEPDKKTSVAEQNLLLITENTWNEN